MKPQPMSQEDPSWESENLVSRVRHDLLQPAAAMKLLLSRLEDLSTSDDVRGLAKILNKSVNELDETVQRIADHMMLEHDLVERAVDPFNIRVWLQGETAQFATQAEAAGLGFQMQVPDQVVTTDKALLGRVVHELLDNAIDFTQEGTISLLVEIDKELKVSICDTGIGLPKPPVQILKKPYFTEQAEKSRRQNRLGIGLPIAALATKRLGGTLNLQSNQNSHGTIASVTIPC